MLYCINFIHEPYAKTCCSDVADKPAVPKKGRKKAEKVVPLLDFDQLVPDLTYFTRPAREPALDKSALASWTTDSFLLPEEWYGKSQGFGSFIIIKERKVSKIATICPPEQRAAPGDVSYDRNDDNFCPGVNEGSNVSVKEAPPVEIASVIKDEEVATFPDFAVNVSFGPKPAKYPKVQIPFSRVLKGFDMSQLKKAICETLEIENKVIVVQQGTFDCMSGKHGH